MLDVKFVFVNLRSVGLQSRFLSADSKARCELQCLYLHCPNPLQYCVLLVALNIYFSLFQLIQSYVSIIRSPQILHVRESLFQYPCISPIAF